MPLSKYRESLSMIRLPGKACRAADEERLIELRMARSATTRAWEIRSRGRSTYAGTP